MSLFRRGGSVTTTQLDLAPVVPLPDVLEPPSSIIIERVQPEIDAGRYPVKRVAGDILQVSADIFKDGHDKIAAVVKYRRTCDEDWQEAGMREVEKKVGAGQDVALELLEGRAVLAEALPRAATGDREVLEAAIAAIDGKGSQAATVRHL